MKKKALTVILAATTLSIAMSNQNKIPVPNNKLPNETPDTTVKAPSETTPADTITLTKRTPQKVYHRFEEIPEISDMEATLYNRNEYTYVVNSDLYQKTGQIKLKRVLKDEVTSVNLISTIYRSECGDYIPKQNEDPLVKYVKDPWIISSNGLYIGSTQMDDISILNFIKYLAATPSNQKYVLPLLKCSKGSVETAAQELQHSFFYNNGDLLPIEERDKAISSKAYTSLNIVTGAWSNLAASSLRQHIQKIRNGTLSDTQKTYLYLAETIPNFNSELEKFQLNFYQLGRIVKPNQIIQALAENLNLKNSKNQVDATRVPTYIISASLSHINWKGNGKGALKSAQQPFSKNWQHEVLQTVKLWVTGKARKYGIDEMSQLNILTPQIIKQYQMIELSGAPELLKEYLKEVHIAESRVKLCANKRGYQASKNAKKTKVLNAQDFTQKHQR